MSGNHTTQPISHYAEVNTMGGYIDSLILKGWEVLFPKTSVQVGDDTKLRGGMRLPTSIRT